MGGCRRGSHWNRRRGISAVDGHHGFSVPDRLRICPHDRHPDCGLFHSEAGCQRGKCVRAQSCDLGDRVCLLSDADESGYDHRKYTAGYGDHDLIVYCCR